MLYRVHVHVYRFKSIILETGYFIQSYINLLIIHLLGDLEILNKQPELVPYYTGICKINIKALWESSIILCKHKIFSKSQVRVLFPLLDEILYCRIP